MYCVVFLSTVFFAETIHWILTKTTDTSSRWQDPSFLFNALSLITYNYLIIWPPCHGPQKNVVHDGKRWFNGLNRFLTGPGIVSNKNWNIPIKWEVVISFWNSAKKIWNHHGHLEYTLHTYEKV